jgi:hypothetical protein
VQRRMKHAKDDQEEKKRQKHNQVPDRVTDTTHNPHVKMKHHDAVASNKQTSDMDTIAKKRKKEKSKDTRPDDLKDNQPANPNIDDLEEHDTPKPPHRKIRKRKSTTGSEVVDDLNNAKIQTKKRKKSVETVDPTNDDSLSDQSRKGALNSPSHDITISATYSHGAYIQLLYILFPSVRTHKLGNSTKPVKTG